jgi:hypothetical protein
METSIPIRFLAFPRGQQTVRQYPSTSNIGDLKQDLVANWPKGKIQYLIECILIPYRV